MEQHSLLPISRPQAQYNWLPQAFAALAAYHNRLWEPKEILPYWSRFVRYTDTELVQVTIANLAHVLFWHGHLGSLKVQK